LKERLEGEHARPLLAELLLVGVDFELMQSKITIKTHQGFEIHLQKANKHILDMV
jgi:hypothetical protein